MLSSYESLLASAGLTVFAIGPSTLAQGQTLVRQAGGNTTLALMLLVLSNTLAVFIAPFLIKAMLASRSDGIHLDSAGLLINLVVTVLAPFHCWQGGHISFNALPGSRASEVCIYFARAPCPPAMMCSGSMTATVQ